MSRLAAAGLRTRPPVLFHKSDLTDGASAGVAPVVLAAIAESKQRVVGVVINAVDDHLARGGQIRVDWTVHRIKPLEELLAAARDAGRAPLIVSDHGHIPEQQTAGRGDASAERWREAARVALPEERIRAMLMALDERSGKLTRTALAKRLGVAQIRLGGMISALRRLLNVDGYPVLSVDEQSDPVELNRKQLLTQFGL